MKKTPLIITATFVVILVIAGYFFFNKENRETTKPISFSEQGNLVRNNPGLVPDTWHIAYEKTGQPGLVQRLRFDANSLCIGKNLRSLCDNTQFSPGMRVQIDGALENEIVLVKSLTLLDTPSETGLPIKLYYYNASFDQGPGGIQCSTRGLVPVERIIPRTNTPIQEAIKLLLRGEISEEEDAQGITSEFPLPGVMLVGASLNNGVLTLEFTDPQNKTGGGSCRVSILWHQIEATAKQFSEVKSVRFIPEELFQP